MGSRGTKRRALAWFPGRAGCRLLDDEFWPDEGPPVGTPRVCRPGPGQLILDQTDGQFTINAGEFIWPIQVLPVWGEQDWHALRTDGTTFEVLGDEALVLQFRGTWIVNDGVAECWFGWSLDVTPDTVANAEHTFYRDIDLPGRIICTSGASDNALQLRDLWPALGEYWEASIVIRAYTPTGLHWYPGAPGVFSYGAHFFVRGGEGAGLVHHLLAWYRELQSRTDPLYPAFSNFDTEGQFDYVEIPCRLPDLSDPLLTPRCVDTFAGAGALAAHTPDYDHIGAGWVEHDGVWTVGGGVVSPDASAPAHAHRPCICPDMWVEADCTPGTDIRSIGLTLRESEPTAGGLNLWTAYIASGIAGNDTILSETIDGAVTVRANADNDWTVDTTYNIRVRLDGVQITMYVDYVEALHYATAWFNADAPHHGLFASNHATAQFDNVLVLPRGTGLTRIAFDSFTDGNDTSLDAHAMDEGGLDWDEHNGNWDIQGNEANVDSSFAQALAVTEVSNIWVSARVLLVTDTKPQGVLFRKGPDTNGSDNHWLYHIASGIAGIDTWLAEVDDGVQTFRATADGDYVAATRYYLQVYANGQTITGYVDGTQRGTFGAATFNELATWHGLYSHTADTGARWDQFRVTEIPAFGEYDQTLDNL